jgi:hypothetical protein
VAAVVLHPSHAGLLYRHFPSTSKVSGGNEGVVAELREGAGDDTHRDTPHPSHRHTHAGRKQRVTQRDIHGFGAG